MLVLIEVARDEEIDRCGRCPCFHHEYPMYCQAIKGDRHNKIVAPYASPRPDWCPIKEAKEDGSIEVVTDGYRNAADRWNRRGNEK